MFGSEVHDVIWAMTSFLNTLLQSTILCVLVLWGNFPHGSRIRSHPPVPQVQGLSILFPVCCGNALRVTPIGLF